MQTRATTGRWYRPSGRRPSVHDPELGEVVVLPFAREVVHVEEAERLPGGGVERRVEVHAGVPRVGVLQLLELQPEDPLVDVEHPPQDPLEGEEDAELLRVDRVLLLPELVLVVAPVPGEDLCVRVTGVADLQAPVLRELRLELGLEAPAQVLEEGSGPGGRLRHPGLDLVVRPRGVAEEARDLVAQGHHLVEEGRVLLLGQRVVGDVHRLSRLLALRVLHHRHPVRGHVGEDHVLPVLAPNRLQELLAHSGELPGREHELVLRLRDVLVEVGGDAGELLLERLHLVPGGLVQGEAGPAVVAHRVLVELQGLALELRALPRLVGVGEGLDRAVHVLAVGDAHAPLLQGLDLAGGRVAHRRVRLRLLHEVDPAARGGHGGADDVEGGHGRFERRLRGVLGGEGVELLVRLRDHGAGGGLDGVGRRFEDGQGHHRLRPGRGGLEIGHGAERGAGSGCAHGVRGEERPSHEQGRRHQAAQSIPHARASSESRIQASAFLPAPPPRVITSSDRRSDADS